MGSTGPDEPADGAESTAERPPGGSDGSRPGRAEPLPAFVDWVLGAFIALAGVGAFVAGGAVTVLVDEALFAEAIEQGDVTVTVGTTELTEPEAIAVADALTWWMGIGLLVIGVGLILFGVGYAVVRRRARGRYRRGEPVSSYGAHAVVGAVVTALVSFLPFSPLFGGGVAGYLERSGSARTISVGALAGVLPAVPAVVFLGFVLVGLVSGLQSVDQPAAAVAAGAALFFAAMVVATVGAVLGALGGYVGGRLAGSGREPTNSY